MIARGQGRIVNITSIGGKASVPHLLSNSNAKFAAVGFSEGLAAEVARHGVGVVTVVLGLTHTGSRLNAKLKGQHRTEYTRCALGHSLPFTSLSAETAAKRIVTAARRGDPEIILSQQAQLVARLHGLFPGLTGDP